MVSLQNMTFAYPGKKELFSGLSLELRPGNIYGLLGKNGVGKTSLLKIMTGLLFPKSGVCKVNEYTSKERHPDLLKEIYFLPEDFSVPKISVKQYRMLNAPFYPKFNLEQFEKMLVEFDLKDQDILTELSYGQKKKFGIAFGLALNTGLLILDEPTNGLDIPSKSKFRKILASELTQERTVVISTHQVRDMENLIDPIIILDAGKIVFQQAMQTISSHLSCKIELTEPKGQDVLYSERVPGGYCVLTAGNGSLETAVDIEVLFNAAVTANEKLNAAFTGGK